MQGFEERNPKNVGCENVYISVTKKLGQQNEKPELGLELDKKLRLD